MADEEESEIDEQVYNELIQAGKSERIARAKAKAAALRASKPQEPEQPSGGGEAEQPAEGAGQAAAQPSGGGEPASTQGAALTPEQRRARVQAALAQKESGGAKQAPARHQEQGQTHRLLAMVPPTGIQQIRSKQEDKVYVWPHLISQEFLALLVMTGFIVMFSLFVNAPLLELANPNVTPDPSKAPWYFLGLQEQLAYFHPMVAGVTVPGVALGLLAATPYLDKNPSIRPENRKTAIVVFTFFLVFWATLVMSGSFFRGPGFNWVWPWIDGVYFEL